MTEATELITIGRIERPFGVKGEVRVRSLSDVPGRFEGLSQVMLVSTSGRYLETAVRGVRKVQNAYLLGMDAFTTPEEAARFRGALLKIPKTDVPPLPPGEYYEFELLGLTVMDESGGVLGTIEDIVEIPSHHVFVIRGKDGEHLLPAIKDVVRSVDVDAGMVTVRWMAALKGAADAV